jgi:N12 class adenine-specific DNA methylase
MALEVKIKNNSQAIQKRFARIQSKFPSIIEKGILQGGFQLLDIIRTKTAKGMDFNDNPFAPYSQGYLNQLNKEGKSTKVDLFYTGRMMGALTPGGRIIKKTGTNKITLGFSNSQMRQRALFNQVLGKTKREFFGFNDRTANIIGRQFNKFVAKEFRKARI